MDDYVICTDSIEQSDTQEANIYIKFIIITTPYICLKHMLNVA